MQVVRHEEILLPASVQDAWALLSDTRRMVELDPAFEAYEPEGGVIQEGTVNHIVSRLGPFRINGVTRTTVLEPPRRAVFENVSPRWPVRVTAEDVLEDADGGCRYRVTMRFEASDPIGWLAIRPMASFLARTRRQVMGRVREELTPPDNAGGSPQA
jgi:hypothetical protein